MSTRAASLVGLAAVAVLQSSPAWARAPETQVRTRPVTLPAAATRQFTVRCRAGVAVDGQWVISQVGSPDAIGPDELGRLGAVRALASRSSAADPSAWTFRFANTGRDGARLTLAATCLHAPGDQAGSLSLLHTRLERPFRNGLSTADARADYDHGESACGHGRILLAPGFDLRHGRARLVASAALDPAVNLSGWTWAYDVHAGGAFQVEHSWRCLRPTRGHGSAGLRARFVPPSGSPAFRIPFGRAAEGQVACPEGSSALLGSWRTEEQDGSWRDLLFLGTTIRRSTRGFRFGNLAAADHRVQLGLVCGRLAG